MYRGIQLKNYTNSGVEDQDLNQNFWFYLN